MASPTVFDDFVRTRGTHLLRVAYLLTHDRNHAEDLLQTALARSWSAWTRIDENPEPYVRRVLVNTYASWRGRRWHGELPSDDLPEVARPAPQGGVDDRDEIWRALSRLPRQQRAVLVLRYFEDMTEAQIADALGISAGTVKSQAAKALAKMRGDETIWPAGFTVPDVPAGTERVDAVHERIRRRHLRRVVGVTVAGVTALALLLIFFLDPHVRIHAEPDPAHPRVGQFHEGDRVVATTQAAITGAATVTFTPTTTDAHLLLGCYVPGIRRDRTNGWMVTPYVNGRQIGSSPGCTNYETDQRLDFDFDDVLQIGVPVTVTARLEWGKSAPATVRPERGEIFLGISEAVPFEAYPLPRRPAHLAALSRTDFYLSTIPPVVVLGAIGPASVRLPAGTYMFGTRSQTPGSVNIVVDGKPLWTEEFWDYDEVTHVYAPDGTAIGKKGGMVTIAVDAENTTGDWLVGIVPVS